MTWTFSDSLDEYRAQAGAFLDAHPAENTVLLTLVDRLASGSPTGGDPDRAPRFGWWRPAGGGPVQGAWLQTPPQPLRLGRMPAAVAAELVPALLDHLARSGAEPRDAPTGVAGGAPVAEAFAAAWAERSGGTVELAENQRLYRLGELTPPKVTGGLRRAEPADQELAVAWFTAFIAEVEVEISDPGAIAVRRLAAGELWIWEDGRRPVSIAGASPVLAGMSRIGPVYTPPTLRGHGYGSAVTAGVSAAIRAAGAAEVVLFTNLANPTSNSIYQKIGYRPVEDYLVLDLRL